MDELVGWMVGWLVGWFGGWVVGWLGGWVVGWLGGWLCVCCVLVTCVGVCVCVCVCVFMSMTIRFYVCVCVCHKVECPIVQTDLAGVIGKKCNQHAMNPSYRNLFMVTLFAMFLVIFNLKYKSLSRDVRKISCVPPL